MEDFAAAQQRQQPVKDSEKRLYFLESKFPCCGYCGYLD